MLAKLLKDVFVCSDCEYETFKWLGKCPQCTSWNSFQLQNQVREKKKTKKYSAIPLNTVKQGESERLIIDNGDFDRIMGGGLINGSLTLISGEPGVGKSTLLLCLLQSFSINHKDLKILYVSGEESVTQIAGRASRLKVNASNIYLLNESSWQEILSVVNKLNPTLIILDSIQTIKDQDILATPGSASQVRGVTQELLDNIKGRDRTAIVVGHITKDGAIAGPKILEHMVDTVVTFKKEADELRRMEIKKNRFGPSGEVAFYKMSKGGIESVRRESEMVNLGVQRTGICYTVSREGGLFLIKEGQALAIENKFGPGKRIVQGLESNRINLLVAAIEKYLKIPLSNYDIYFNVARGNRFNERWSDLGIVACILSSYYEVPIPKASIFLGEIGLSGDIRKAALDELEIEKLRDWGVKNIFWKGSSNLNVDKMINYFEKKEILDLKEMFINKAS